MAPEYDWEENEPSLYVKPENAEFIAHAREDIPYLLDRLAEAEAELARLREAQRWVPVADGLPEDNCAAIVVNRKRQVHEALYWNGEWMYFGEIADITHWMPLPAKPEEGE